MRDIFNEQLEQLNSDLVEMGTLIGQVIRMTVEALVDKDIEKAKKVIRFEDQIDRQEKTIENLCLKLLLQQQPVASDFTQISAALKMITDMERIGDQSADISQILIGMAGQPYIKKLDHIQAMANETTRMVFKSIDAYVKKDLELAKEVIKQDDIVDSLFLTIKNELIELINENTENGEQATDLLMIGKYFERIGDHATNIAEWVIFSITGKHDDIDKITE